MIKKIKWDVISSIWAVYLWPDRTTPIEPASAMLHKGNHDLKNFLFSPTYFAYIINQSIVGVNSGHKCCDGSYRSRGLYVFPEYRKQGIGTSLLLHTIKQGEIEGATYTWSYPRKESWGSYKNAGFILTSDWHESENGYNAFCSTKEI